MLKKELEQRVEELESMLYEANTSNNQKDDDIEELENDIARLNKDNHISEIGNAYIRGQLEVLKRVSRLYIEEIPTREEYRGTEEYREV